MAYRDSLVGDYLWLLRVLCEFVAGMLLCAGFSRVSLTDVHRRAADRVALVIPLVAVAWFQLTERWVSDAALVLWLPFVACLAVGSGPVTRFLSRPRLVVLGELSFALYLLHGPMFKVTRDVAGAAGVSDLARPYVEMLVAVGCLGLAWVMHRYVEEPARIALSPSKREAPHVQQRA